MTCPSCGAPENSEYMGCGYCEEHPESRLPANQQDTPYVLDLIDHKSRVKRYLQIGASEMGRRSVVHDNSKVEPEEFYAYNEAFPELQKYAYGTDEFKAALKKIEPAVQHHYQANDHHPEHFANGVDDMDLFQLFEMTCDWLAASERSQRDIMAGLEINNERFHITPQLAGIIKRTIIKLQKAKEVQEHKVISDPNTLYPDVLF